jgi:hypothetical protein
MKKVKSAGTYGWRHRMQLFVNFYTLKHAHAPLPSWWQPLFQDLLTSPERGEDAADLVCNEPSPLPMARATGGVTCQVVRWEWSPSPPAIKQPQKQIAKRPPVANEEVKIRHPLKPVQPVYGNQPPKRPKQVGQLASWLRDQ